MSAVVGDVPLEEQIPAVLTDNSRLADEWLAGGHRPPVLELHLRRDGIRLDLCIHRFQKVLQYSRFRVI